MQKAWSPSGRTGSCEYEVYHILRIWSLSSEELWPNWRTWVTGRRLLKQVYDPRAFCHYFLILVRWDTEVRCRGVLPQNSGNHRLWIEPSEVTIQLNPSSLLNLFSRVLLSLWLRNWLSQALSLKCVGVQSSHGGKPFSYTRANISLHSTELAVLTFKALENICSQWITEEYSRELGAGGGAMHYTSLCGRDRKGPWRSRRAVIGSELQTFWQAFWWIPVSPHHYAGGLCRESGDV